MEVLAVLAPTLQQAMDEARRKAFLILDGTLLPIDRIAEDRPYYSGKHKRHGMNVHVIADPHGKLHVGLARAARCHARPDRGAHHRDHRGAEHNRADDLGRSRVPGGGATHEGADSRAGNSNDGSAATTPPTQRSAASANRLLPH